MTTAHPETRFRALWRRTIGTGRPREVFTILDVAYASPARCYHSWFHVAALLRELDQIRGIAEFSDIAFDEVELAIFFHDAVYVAGRQDNEARSAALFLELASSSAIFGVNALARVTRLIEATATHNWNQDMATRLMIDLDLSIVGAPPDIYKSYVSGVRQEYSHLTDALWTRGRNAVLNDFLARQRIYQTEHFHQHFEPAARANMMTERQQLNNV